MERWWVVGGVEDPGAKDLCGSMVGGAVSPCSEYERLE